MQPTILFILVICGIYLVFKNYTNMKRYKQEKAYVTLYSDMLKNVEGYDERIENYMKTETDEEFLNKARIIQIYSALLNNRECADLMEEFDFYDLIFSKNGFDSRKVTNNSDSFIWTIMTMARASQLSMADVVDGLYDRISKYADELDKYVEFQVTRAVYESLMEKNTNGLSFLKDLLAGEYDGYTYDKRLIGIFKRIAATVLSYAREEVDEYYQEDLKAFANTLLGEKLMTDLGILEKYRTPVEETAETEEAESAAEENETAEEVCEEVESSQAEAAEGSAENKE